MKCLRKVDESEGYIFLNQPVPTPGPDEVIVKIDKVAICGSDIILWRWSEMAKLIATVPFIPGHEATGQVVTVGSNVSSVKVGDRIAVENHYYCGNCFQCKIDRGDICQNMSQYGHGKGTTQGGCSQYSSVPSKYCYVLTRDITSNQAVLLEPMGVAHNAIEAIGVKGEDVLVIGC